MSQITYPRPPSSPQPRDQQAARYYRLPYQYRDGSNYKQAAAIYLLGTLTPADLRAIRAVLDDGEFFIPHDLALNIEELQPRMKDFPCGDDHVWHSLDLASVHPVASLPEGARAIEVTRFVAAFTRVGAPRNWKEAEAHARLGVCA